MPSLARLRLRAAAIKARALRALAPSRADIVFFRWPLLPDECPCDLHFCDYLRERGVSGKSVFHFGSGDHHLVGRTNHDDGRGNEILSVTYSAGEHRSYLRRVIREPSWGRHYKVLFGDIYDLSGALLPSFDLVTLFHLCEYTPDARERRRLDDAGLLDLFVAKTAPGGRLFFYRDSAAAARALPLIERASADGRIAFEESYRSLTIYRRAVLAPASPAGKHGAAT